MRYAASILPRFLVVLMMILAGCPSTQEGAVEGVVNPPNAGARVAVTRDGKTVTVLDINSQDGRFRIPLTPGAYDVNVTAPSSPLPMTFPGTVIEPGKTTGLPPIDFAPASGTATLTGKILPASAATKVTLLYEGRERAAINTDAAGTYEFSGLAPGMYSVRVNTPGYAAENLETNIAQDRMATQNVRLLYVTPVDGVDWAAGKIRAVGVGIPPGSAASATISREMAKRAALADAQRNLLKIIDQIKINPEQDIKSLMGAKDYTEKVQGFIQGYKIIGEKELEGGKIQVELELPLTGAGGLSAMIRER